MQTYSYIAFNIILDLYFLIFCHDILNCYRYEL